MTKPPVDKLEQKITEAQAVMDKTAGQKQAVMDKYLR